MSRRASLLIPFLFISSLMLSAQETRFPFILDVTENTQGTQITINGIGFGKKAPKVSLGATELTVAKSSDTSVTADLPAGTAPGAYLLTIDNKESRFPAIFTADIGQVGPAGPAGATGPAGPMGPVGLQGPAGPAGPVGLQGPAGPAGATGAAGPIGPAGPAGATGAKGATGATGATGPAGPIGPAGPMGAQGTVGNTGPAGPAGAVGPAGPAGPTGPAGATGAAGGEIWSANTLLPSSITTTTIGAPSGVSNAQGFFTGGSWQGNILPLPQSCTASNFSVTVLGAAHTSTALVTIGYSSVAQIESSPMGIAPSSLSCTITAANGAAASCTSNASFSFAAPTYLTLVLYNFQTPADYENARVMASWV